MKIVRALIGGVADPAVPPAPRRPGASNRWRRSREALTGTTGPSTSLSPARARALRLPAPRWQNATWKSRPSCATQQERIPPEIPLPPVATREGKKRTEVRRAKIALPLLGAISVRSMVWSHTWLRLVAGVPATTCRSGRRRSTSPLGSLSLPATDLGGRVLSSQDAPAHRAVAAGSWHRRDEHWRTRQPSVLSPPPAQDSATKAFSSTAKKGKWPSFYNAFDSAWLTPTGRDYYESGTVSGSSTTSQHPLGSSGHLVRRPNIGGAEFSRKAAAFFAKEQPENSSSSTRRSPLPIRDPLPRAQGLACWLLRWRRRPAPRGSEMTCGSRC